MLNGIVINQTGLLLYFLRGRAVAGLIGMVFVFSAGLPEDCCATSGIC